jgi:uncharacterized protein YeaO (DUF488 family)
MGAIYLKRVYEPASAGDGFRILVDRLWPRGLSKDKASIDYWAKDIAPSDALRKWFAHDPAKWAIFQRRYIAELKRSEAALKELQKILHTKKAITLLYAAKDQQHNQAIVLKKMLST